MEEVANIKETGGDVVTLEQRFEIIEEGIRKKYLSRLDEMQIAPFNNALSIEEDLIENVRLFKINEMVYEKDESVTDKFTTVFNTLSTYNTSVFVLVDSDGVKTDFYLGVRNNESDERKKRSTVTLGDTLKNTLLGNFSGMKIQNEDRRKIKDLCNKIEMQHNAASVSVVGNKKDEKLTGNAPFVQGLEKLALAMNGRKYIGLIIAENNSSATIQKIRRDYQNLYTELSPYQKMQISEGQSESTSRSKSFSEMNGKQKTALIGKALIGVAGMAGGAYAATRMFNMKNASQGLQNVSGYGPIIGGQVGSQLAGLISAFAPVENISKTQNTSTTTTHENKIVTDMLSWLDEGIKKTNEYDSYGLWNVAGYFVSDDMSAAEIAASNYRSLMNGEKSGREVSAINSWRSNSLYTEGDFFDLTRYLSRFTHPEFVYGQTDYANIFVNAATSVSGKELGLHLGLPRATVAGLPVIEHAEFAKDVVSYSLFEDRKHLRPEDRMTLGKVFDLGRVTENIVELDNKSLNMHTFITGSTGSGKSNTVYQILNELYQDKIPFLVVEPAKGEYKDVFGNREDVNVYATNPQIASLINLNPFKFPDSIHVLEHVDGLVEIFSVCWPMYDAMPAFFKEAILKSYEEVGWDLGSSTFENGDVTYPSFEIVVEELEKLIDETEYSAEVKGNYTGALVTRVKSLTVGLNKFIFTENQTPYEKLFDENCILDLSRVKSGETKALIMGLMVYILNEYRVDTKETSNSALKHITVLEEAHNLLKNTKEGESELVGKSVEMLTNTIAEIRTYGEGFIIVDQSPSSVDISAIKNTNTKIVLRTPEASDREAVGKSMGLSRNQINEIAKLPGGVAVVYQNDWVSPVLTLINKADIKESAYVNRHEILIKSVKRARTEVIKAIMEPWMPGERISLEELKGSLNSLEVSRNTRKMLDVLLPAYNSFNGHICWEESSLYILRALLLDILDISKNKFKDLILQGTPCQLRRLVENKTVGLNEDEIDEICCMLTREE